MRYVSFVALFIAFMICMSWTGKTSAQQEEDYAIVHYAIDQSSSTLHQTGLRYNGSFNRVSAEHEIIAHLLETHPTDYYGLPVKITVTVWHDGHSRTVIPRSLITPDNRAELGQIVRSADQGPNPNKTLTGTALKHALDAMSDVLPCRSLALFITDEKPTSGDRPIFVEQAQRARDMGVGLGFLLVPWWSSKYIESFFVTHGYSATNHINNVHILARHDTETQLDGLVMELLESACPAV